MSRRVFIDFDFSLMKSDKPWCSATCISISPNAGKPANPFSQKNKGLDNRLMGFRLSCRKHHRWHYMASIAAQLVVLCPSDRIKRVQLNGLLQGPAHGTFVGAKKLPLPWRTLANINLQLTQNSFYLFDIAPLHSPLINVLKFELIGGSST